MTQTHGSPSEIASTVGDAGLVVVVEDDIDLQSILAFNLQKKDFKVKCFAKAEDALYFMDSSPNLAPTLLILDVNLAGRMNGYELTKQIRTQKRFSKTPLLMLTARGEAADVVRGLDEGADDYLPKPFEIDVFLARVKSCVRRGERATGGVGISKKAISLAEIDVDPSSHQVTVQGKSVELTATEYGILTTLMGRPNEVFSRDDLLLRLVGPNKVITGRTIDVHIRALREKLEKKAENVVTVRGFGYKFVV